ncbi:MAG: Uma2 family endonuclease [Caldilineaceae bacterium]
MVIKTKQAPSSNPVVHPTPNGSGQLEPDDDPFRYGWRTVAETLPDGQIHYHDIPLTPEDYLDPQLGDYMVQSDPHLILVVSLYNRFKKKYHNDPTTGVFSDLKMFWDKPDLKEPAPDLAIVPKLKTKKARRRSFNVRKEGTRPCLIVEVVSPDYPGDDTVKVKIYEQVGITEYIIIDLHFENETKPGTLTGYRLVDGVYQPIQPDAQGQLLSETTGVQFGLDDSKRDVVLTNAVTGERLLDDEEEYEARLEEQQARLAAEARAAAAEAELARVKALLATKNGKSE